MANKKVVRKKKIRARVSAEDKALALIREQMLVMREMIAASTEQSKVLQSYLKLFTDVPQPAVRQMTDVDEFNIEKRLNQMKSADDTYVSGKVPIIDPSQWMQDMTQTFDTYKKEIV